MYGWFYGCWFLFEFSFIPPFLSLSSCSSRSFLTCRPWTRNTNDDTATMTMPLNMRALRMWWGGLARGPDRKAPSTVERKSAPFCKVTDLLTYQGRMIFQRDWRCWMRWMSSQQETTINVRTRTTKLQSWHLRFLWVPRRARGQRAAKLRNRHPELPWWQTDQHGCDYVLYDIIMLLIHWTRGVLRRKLVPPQISENQAPATIGTRIFDMNERR